MASKPPHIAQELLSRSFSPESAERIFKEQVLKKPLLLRPVDSAVSDAREARRKARAQKEAARSKALPKPKPLTAREKRALDIYKIPKEARRYEIYEPLHRMWTGYIQEVLGGEACLPVTATTASKLCSADFHGAEIKVVRSRCVGRVGLRGIVVKDTKFAFEIITKTNQIKIIPKEHTIFRFEIPSPSPGHAESEAMETDATHQLVFELQGSQFQNRATDRANKKFKSHHLPDL